MWQRPQEKWEAQFFVTCPHSSLMDTNKALLKWVFPECIVFFFQILEISFAGNTRMHIGVAVVQ